jgi:pimeloyl-ACP methyl ester carboxylesterase
MQSRVVTQHGFAAFVLAIVSALGTTIRADVRPVGTRAEGLHLGPHAVGFELIRGIDYRRRINGDEGTRIGIAVWYPARPAASNNPAVTNIDYRLLEFSKPPTALERRALEAEEIDALVGWRHVGIVPLTPEQAKQSLETPGIAVPHMAARPGRFPLVMILGGPYYLSTTAEFLASHGLLIVAPFRFRDQSDERETDDFRCYVEDSLSDAEWALDELRTDPRVDSRSISAIGHGGGGMQAMLLAMRNRSVTAAVNIDAGNFSSRSQPGQIVFYNPRLMRVPYLYIATIDTRKTQDRFDDFVAMKFADRTEVMLGSSDIRHHDLSDIGRGVTMPMRIRGQAQPIVERNYTAVQEIVMRFIVEHAAGRTSTPARLSEWLDEHKASDDLTVTVRPRIEPAPTTTAVLQSLSDATLSGLTEARQRDPEAAIFQERSLWQLVTSASARQPRLAEALADFAVNLHPTSAVLLEQASQIALGAGDRAKAAERARRCASIKVESDWQASIAVAKCGALLQRLQ